MENSASRTWRGVWRGALAALVAALAVGSGYAFWLNGLFKKEGVETMGVVTRIYTKTEYRTRRVTRRTSRREKVTVHYLDYRFSVGGQEFEDSHRLGSASVGVRKGDSIAVCYLPGDPARNRPARDSAKNLKIRRIRPRPYRR